MSARSYGRRDGARVPLVVSRLRACHSHHVRTNRINRDRSSLFVSNRCYEKSHRTKTYMATLDILSEGTEGPARADKANFLLLTVHFAQKCTTKRPLIIPWPGGDENMMIWMSQAPPPPHEAIHSLIWLIWKLSHVLTRRMDIRGFVLSGLVYG